MFSLCSAGLGGLVTAAAAKKSRKTKRKTNNKNVGQFENQRSLISEVYMIPRGFKTLPKRRPQSATTFGMAFQAAW
jgi:hypothetical protein